MMAKVRLRFWLAAALALATLVLSVITLVWQNWIELVFGFDPDHGSGSLERVIVGVAALLCLASVVLASSEWRRAAARTVPSSLQR